MIVSEVGVSTREGWLGSFKWDRKQRVYLFSPTDGWQFSSDELRKFAKMADKLTKQYRQSNRKGSEGDAEL